MCDLSKGKGYAQVYSDLQETEEINSSAIHTENYLSEVDYNLSDKRLLDLDTQYEENCKYSKDIH